MKFKVFYYVICVRPEKEMLAKNTLQNHLLYKKIKPESF